MRKHETNPKQEETLFHLKKEGRDSIFQKTPVVTNKGNTLEIFQIKGD